MAKKADGNPVMIPNVFLGAIVHFVNPRSLHDQLGECEAAIVTGICAPHPTDRGPDVVNLTVFGFGQERHERHIPLSHQPAARTWHWPEKI